MRARKGFIPDFMKEFDTFDRQRRSIRTLDEWHSFRKRWFDHTDWPLKSGKQLIKEMKKDVIPIVLNGRGFAPGHWLYDLSAEARYEYFWTLHVIGDPLLCPDWNKVPRTRETGWQQECAYCQISTWDFGDDTCPRCGRTMYYNWVPY